MVKLKHKKHRIIKTNNEISYITEAVRHTENAIRYALSVFEPGMTEKQLARKIKLWAKNKKLKLGFLLVQGDKNTASIHGKPSDQVINHILLIDVGLVHKGYFSDITRTYLINPTKEMKKVYRTVKRSHDKAISAIKIGKKCRDVDAVARRIIKNYGQKFKHSLGHGVGKQVHELPKINPKSDAVFERNMVFTIEPGIYLKGRFGVRIEDTLVLKNKPKILSKIKIPKY